MKVEDLMHHHKCKTRRELALKTGYSEVTLWKWEKKESLFAHKQSSN